jgi:hypothetical protein
MDVNEVLRSLAGNGPWAALAGFLLWYVLRAWEQERKEQAVVLRSIAQSVIMLQSAVTEFRQDVAEFRNEVRQLGARIDQMDGGR